MDKYSTMADFGGAGVIPLLKAVITSVPVFFPVILFFVWIFGTASSYFAIYSFTGKKRFWHSLTAMSFAMFIASLLVAGMNEIDFTFFKWILGFILYFNDSCILVYLR